MTPREFEAAHQADWSELESAVDRPMRELDPDRFLALYRMCCEHLALAQARGFPLHVVDRLSALASRAHQIAYRQSDPGFKRIVRVLLDDFPRMVRKDWRYIALAAALFVLPMLALGFAVYLRPELINAVVDRATAAEYGQMYNPAARAIGHPRTISSDWMMFGFYIKNNIGIAFQCYATGVVFGVGSLLFLAFNGGFSGAIGGYIASLGYGGTFFPFVATHSAFELTAIVLSGAAGLRIGRAVFLPGQLTRTAALQIAARETSVIIFGAAVMLLIAAVIEAFWSSAAWVDPSAKFVLAGFCWLLVFMFFFRRGHAN